MAFFLNFALVQSQSNKCIHLRKLFLIQTPGQDGYLNCHCWKTAKAQVSALLSNCLCFVNIVFPQISGTDSWFSKWNPHLEIRNAEYGTPASDPGLNQKFCGGSQESFFFFLICEVWLVHHICLFNFYFYLILSYFLNWRIISLQRCASFWCKITWTNYK